METLVVLVGSYVVLLGAWNWSLMALISRAYKNNLSALMFLQTGFTASSHIYLAYLSLPRSVAVEMHVPRANVFVDFENRFSCQHVVAM